MEQAIKETKETVQVMENDLMESLYAIRGVAESALSHEDQARAQNALSLTMRKANKVIDMIHHFRDIAFATQRKDAASVPVSVHDSVADVLHAMAYEFPFRNITLLKILPHNLPRLSIPREHLDTIFFQLIYNARRSIGDQGGVITVEAQEGVTISSGLYERHFVIRVSDTGEEIDDELLPHIFDPFFSKGEWNSTLGLYVVRKLVEMNSGSVRVESSEKGTSFYLDFPL